MKFHGIKKIVSEVKRLENTDENWVINLNTKTKKTWLRENIHTCNWSEYNNKNVWAVITRKQYTKRYVGKINMKNLQLILEEYVRYLY